MLPNDGANGPAWYVRNVKTVNNPTEELKTICEVNTRTTAVVDGSKFKPGTAASDSTALITIAEHRPNYLKYESQSQSDGLAVFSEIYYEKGWTASIDGKEVPILRADYVLRALNIPAVNTPSNSASNPKLTPPAIPSPKYVLYWLYWCC